MDTQTIEQKTEEQWKELESIPGCFPIQGMSPADAWGHLIVADIINRMINETRRTK